MKFQKKILVIEDDQNLGITIQNILTLHRFDVCYVNNGASGIQKAFEYNPDLILCDINMDPIDGYQVYKVLDESAILSRIPFVFLTASSELEEIRFGMSLGADDYLVKPFHNDDLIKSIEKRLEKFQSIRDEANREFDRLFSLSPFGLLIFDWNKVYKVNPAFSNQVHSDLTVQLGIKIEDLIDPKSIEKLKVKIQEPFLDRKELFNEEVTLLSRKGNAFEMNMVVSEFKKFSNYILYLGLFTSASKAVISIDNRQYADEVYNLLKRENIRFPEALGEKITNIFAQKSLNQKDNKNSLFTQRENQVLGLSMEGLPIKTIADRLAISDRTVEKHRTRLMKKAGANNMIEVIVFALKNSLIKI